jgi:hypothetical protein
MTLPHVVSPLICTEFLNKQQAHDSYGGLRISLVEPTTPFRGDSHRDKFVEVNRLVGELCK